MTPYRERLNQGAYTGAFATPVKATQPLEPIPDEADTDEALTCPDCGRDFTSAHGLAVHQAKSHT